MGVWYIMMSISMYMSCVFQWFLVFSDLWQPRSGPGFFSSVFCTPVCLVCLTWAAVSSCAHKHPWDFLHERSPSEIAWHECRQKFSGFAQPSLKGLHLSAGATQHQSCLYARRCVACAHQIAGDLSCWIRLCSAVVDTAVQTTKGRSYFWIARCAITAQRLVPSVGCRNRIASSCSWYFRKTFWRRLAVPLCSCNTNVPKNELATSLVAGRIAFDHTEPLMIMQAATRLPMSHRRAIGFDDATQLHVTLHSHSNCSLMLQQDVHQAIQCPARRSRNSKLLSKHVSRRMISV